MSRTTLLLASMALALVLVSGVALAITKTCKVNAERCTGTDNPDLLIGSVGADEIWAFSGSDVLRGRYGLDKLRGGEGDDLLEGGPDGDVVGRDTQGADRIYGGAASDELVDGSESCGGPQQRVCVGDLNLIDGGDGGDEIFGHNRLRGGAGDDRIIGADVSSDSGSREIIGGMGNDRIESHGDVDDIIHADDGERDRVFCGNGSDRVYVDRGLDDVNTTNCETILDPP